VLHAAFGDGDGRDGKKKRFYYLTDFRPDYHNVSKLVNKAGRMRWKIEDEGFNVQKDGGYALEHDYGSQGHAAKNFYCLRQIACMMAQLMYRGDVFGKLQIQSR